MKAHYRTRNQENPTPPTKEELRSSLEIMDIPTIESDMEMICKLDPYSTADWAYGVIAGMRIMHNRYKKQKQED